MPIRPDYFDKLESEVIDLESEQDEIKREARIMFRKLYSILADVLFTELEGDGISDDSIPWIDLLIQVYDHLEKVTDEIIQDDLNQVATNNSTSEEDPPEDLSGWNYDDNKE